MASGTSGTDRGPGAAARGAAVALTLAVAMLGGCTFLGDDPAAETRVTPTRPEVDTAVEATVTRTTTVIEHVVDGDTVVVEGGIHVRLIGCDTPERDRCGYEESTALLRTFAEGREAELVDPASVQDTDTYGRLLRYVSVDGQDMGELMLRSGLAVARYDGLDGYDPHPLQDLYRELDATYPHVCGID